MIERTQKHRGYVDPGSREEKMISEGGPIYFHQDQTEDQEDVQNTVNSEEQE